MLWAVLLLCCIPPTVLTVSLKIGYDVMSSMFRVYSVLNNETFSVCYGVPSDNHNVTEELWKVMKRAVSLL